MLWYDSKTEKNKEIQIQVILKHFSGPRNIFKYLASPKRKTQYWGSKTLHLIIRQQKKNGMEQASALKIWEYPIGQKGAFGVCKSRLLASYSFDLSIYCILRQLDRAN